MTMPDSSASIPSAAAAASAPPLAARAVSSTTNLRVVTPTVLPPGARDLRLDFFRGLALLCIFIDHIPENRIADFTIRVIGLSDASELFIFISG